jgi:hypothetical protein
MKRAISAWLHKFSEAAEKALTAEFLRQDLKTDAKKAEFVRFLLGDVNDISSKNRPFIWESVYDNPKADDAARPQVQSIACIDAMFLNVEKGIFQGRLVARTFLEHLLVTSGVPKGLRIRERPVGALILSIQAVCLPFVVRCPIANCMSQVHRALLYSASGTFRPPGSKIEAAFSKQNWGDHSTTMSHKTVKRHSVFQKRIMGLKDLLRKDLSPEGEGGTSAGIESK